MNLIKIAESINKFKEEKHNSGFNKMSVVNIRKVVITTGITKFIKEGKKIDTIKNELAKVIGQVPCIVKAKVSCDSFHIRKNDIVALKATLRKEKMYSFLEKTVFFVLPRTNDFKGFKDKSISRGTFNFGIKDYTYFYEIDKRTSPFNNLGFHVHLDTTSKNKNDTLEFLRYIGFPI